MPSLPRSLNWLTAAALLALPALGAPAKAYDLQYRLNGANLTPTQLQQAMNRGLPSSYDQQFPEQQWTTYLLVDGHPSQGLVAITMGLCPRVGRSKALLPLATYSVIQPLPGNGQEWEQLLSSLAREYGSQMLNNRGRISNQR